MAVAAVSNLAYGQGVKVTPKNPIVNDTTSGGHFGHTIMSVDLRSNTMETWFFQGLKIEDVEITSTAQPENSEIRKFSIYELRYMSFYIDGNLVGSLDSIIKGNNLVVIGAEFAAGTRFEVKAQFPEGKGILQMKIMLSFKKGAEYEKFNFEQIVYQGTPDTTSSSVLDFLKFGKIVMCQNTNDKTITLKNFPAGETLKVYNLQGVLIHENEYGKYEEIIKFENLPIGIYTILIGDAFYKKVVI